MQSIALLGIPLCHGTDQFGPVMGPDGMRAAGLQDALIDLGLEVQDHGNLPLPVTAPTIDHANSSIHDLGKVVRWISAIRESAATLLTSTFPIFLGGDHSLAAGTIAAVAAQAAAVERPLFVLWLDAHPDFHSLSSTQTGNLHGTPMAYLTGQPDFAPPFPALSHRVDPKNVLMLGLRSVDPAERQALADHSFDLCDMRSIDEFGVVKPLRAFLERVKEAKGWLHVSLDVDVLDPSIAPGVSTPVPGGATEREAHLIMELVHESGTLSSLDIVELNPFHDMAGKTARLIVALTASLFGKRILDT